MRTTAQTRAPSLPQTLPSLQRLTASAQQDAVCEGVLPSSQLLDPLRDGPQQWHSRYRCCPQPPASLSSRVPPRPSLLPRETLAPSLGIVRPAVRPGQLAPAGGGELEVLEPHLATAGSVGTTLSVFKLKTFCGLGVAPPGDRVLCSPQSHDHPHAPHRPTPL